MNDTTAITQPQPGLPKPRPSDFAGMLKSYLPEIQRALPKHLNADRMARIALTCFRQTPSLAKCDPLSVFAAVVQCSQMGLEPGIGGEAHLIPFKTQCTMVIGYQGLVKLAMQSGLVSSIEAHCVYTGDEFALELGINTKLKHIPYLDGDRGDLRLVYAVAHLTNSTVPVVDFMIKDQVYAIRNASQGYKSAKQYGKDHPWINPAQEPEMWRKTMIRRICKRLPKSAELNAAIGIMDAGDMGKPQTFEISQVAKNEYTPPALEYVDFETGEITEQEVNQ